MTVEEIRAMMTDEMEIPVELRKPDGRELSSSEVFQWLQERQVNKTLIDDDASIDSYDLLFHILFDWYVIFMLLWRKVKWTARQVQRLHDENTEFATVLNQAVTVYFTLDAVKKWSKCTSTIDHGLKQGAFELSGSFEQMIEEEIKWEYIY